MGLRLEHRNSYDEIVFHPDAIRWQTRNLTVPLAQLAAIDADESTSEAIGDWHYWVAQGYCF
jgi:hypothetical protein